MSTIDGQAVQALTERLISAPSVTPQDAGCLEILGDRLTSLGFTLERMDRDGVSNLWATWGVVGPMVCFAGHTDVVPTGDASLWRTSPFQPTVIDGHLFGRGAADMKASLAAMIVAIEVFLHAHPSPQGRISCLFTSDEEGVATAGTTHVVETLRQRPQPVIDYCVVGEPSSQAHLGDMIRVGRRGSLNASVRVQGRQGHVAYPEQVVNPIHQLAGLIAALTDITWDVDHNAYFPPTSFQVSNLTAGTGATNMVPDSAQALMNWRYSTSTTAEAIQAQVLALIDQLGLTAEVTWTLSGRPFVTPRGRLTSVVSEVIESVTGQAPELSTGGGTSDGRFIATLGCELVELGPINATIHQVNETVAVADLKPLAELYYGILDRLIGSQSSKGMTSSA